MTNVSYWKILIRKKILPNDESQTSKLGRVLGTLDLAALGIGATLGVGVYVLAGNITTWIFCKFLYTFFFWF